MRRSGKTEFCEKSGPAALSIPLDFLLRAKYEDESGAFSLARQRAEVGLQDKSKTGVGRLNERLVHATLKYYLEPDEAFHERPACGYIADIWNNEGIIEIQTGGMSSIKRKLERFLEVCPVTIVYPAVACKYLCWIDPETGECTKPRKSPKEGRGLEVFRELYGLREMLTDERLAVRVLLLDLIEYRELTGWSHDRKKGSERYERYPLCVRNDVTLRSPESIAALLPGGLPAAFISDDFARVSKLSRRAASWILPVLEALRVIRRTGKRGNFIVYEIAG